MTKLMDAMGANFISNLAGATPERMMVLTMLSDAAQGLALKSNSELDNIQKRWEQQQKELTEQGVKPTDKRWIDAYDEVQKDKAVWRGHSKHTLTNSELMLEKVSK